MEEMERSKKIKTYIGTYTRRESFVDGKAEGIYIFHLDQATGALTHHATVTGPGTINPSYLILSPDKSCLYAVNEITGSMGPHGTVSGFAVDPATGHLTFLNHQSTHGLAPCYVCIEPEGQFCLVANYGTGSVCVLPIQENGMLGKATDVVHFSGSGPDRERQKGPHAHMVVPGRDRDHILATDLGADRLMAFHLDRKQGRLIPADPPWTQLPAGSGPRHLALHPHQPTVYIMNELQSTITVLRVEEHQDKLTAIQTISTLPDDFAGQNLGATIKVSPSGRFVYASNRGHDSLVAYAVEEKTGRLSVVGYESTQGIGPRDFTITPSGHLLLVANQNTDTVVTFWIEQELGTLWATGHVAAVPTPVCLKLA